MCLKDGFEEAIAYYGGGPVKEHYMPAWAAGQATHYMMYETVTEGTPISPALRRRNSWRAG